MDIEKAKQIYEYSLNEGLAADLILQLEGLNEAEYNQALKLYLKTLEPVDHTLDPDEYDEPEPDKYYCWCGTRIPQWFE